MGMLDYFSQLPKEIVVFFMAMLPVTELRGSIPIAITVWGIKPFVAYFVSVIGNLIPMIVIIYAFDPIQRYLSDHSRLARKFFNWLYTRTRNRLDAKYKKYGPLALGLFVAIPLPVTGVWTGAVAAWLFSIRKAPALIFITLGALMSGIIVTAITLGFTFVL